VRIRAHAIAAFRKLIRHMVREDVAVFDNVVPLEV
jgi:hypothetical protein